jgi:peptidoglycan/xylan/chitin deacetylase (PgdA/CDA1 family)
MNGKRLIRNVVFDALYYSRWLHLMQLRRSGIGVIFTLHRVVAPGTPILAADLAAQSDLLDRTLGYIRHMGWDIVNLTEVHRRLAEGHTKSNFACFTFDDGYLDNLTNALPVFRKHGAPMCVYITTGLIEREVFLWWPVLEHMLLTRDRINNIGDSAGKELPTITLRQKKDAYLKFVPWADKCNSSAESNIMNLFLANGVDPGAILDPMVLTWDQARKLAADPLVEIGCHTVSHPSLATLEFEAAVQELAASRAMLEQKLGVAVRHVSYPYGTKVDCSVREFDLAQKLGFLTATTTRRGNIFMEHKDHLTALPRVNMLAANSVSLRFVRESLFGESRRPNFASALVTD